MNEMNTPIIILTKNVEPLESIAEHEEHQHKNDGVDCFLLVVRLCSFLQTFHADLTPTIPGQVRTPVGIYIHLRKDEIIFDPV